MRLKRDFAVVSTLGVVLLTLLPAAPAAAQCDVTAKVVAMDQVLTYNRMGAFNPAGMIFALARDVFPKGTLAAEQTLEKSCASPTVTCSPGNVQLRDSKRPRPLTLRVNEGDTICIDFTNLLSNTPGALNTFVTDAQNEAPGIQLCEPTDGTPRPGICQSEQPVTRNASLHVHGMIPAGIGDDGSNVGITGSSLVAPGGWTTYTLEAGKEGAYVITSGPNLGGEGGSGAIASGLFGVMNVEPVGSTWYRSQLTRAEMDLATPAEEFIDWNDNEAWDASVTEPFTDWNENEMQDNGIAEPLTDWNGNEMQDNGIAEPLTDWNGNGVQDNGIAEPFEDTVVENGTLDPGEPFTDWNGNLAWDASVDEPFTDWNGTGVWDASVDEPFTDWNDTGVWDASVDEPFTDWSGNGTWDSDIAEPVPGDTNGDGIWQAHRQTAGGQPILDYNAVYPAGHPYVGAPILKIFDGTEIVHNELNAVIDGPMWNDKAPYELYPNRGEAFRELTIAFHDEVKIVQAFPEWFNQLAFTLGSVKDGFAVNYGTGGIGSEIIGNRLGVGPMHECVECKYEEFFLTSWAVGDPAMIVDIPANAGLETCDPALNNCLDVGPKATKAFYPDDPSNVFHGYLNDRTKVRNIHVGTEHHIFHLHAHQWNFSNLDNEDDQSNYLDAQLIGPGSSFTYEITYGGAGNRNKTPGDSIFHCHFYPHFAQGMWGLWRVHDVFERGSVLDADGRVLERGLPDSEICADGAGGSECGGYVPGTATAIAGGTPVPAVVPIPGKAMAPMPGMVLAALEDTNSDGLPDSPSLTDSAPFMGYPFYIPGVAGHRPPTPPVDLIADGGLPRHVIVGGDRHTVQTATDFDAVLEIAHGIEIPEEGTLEERVAMAFHGPQASTGLGPVYHESFLSDGSALPLHLGFEVNGLPPNFGAPYAEPCRTDSYDGGTKGSLVGNPRFYAASVIELDMDLNKVGWHFGQQRILALDGDVADTLAGTRAPEPLVMRANSGDCVDMNHTNLVPNVYQLDDFQVKTPTDVIGQHIHLVKFDVTSADGAANGWNYEDGTFSPDEVHERLVALEAGTWNGVASPFNTACGADNLDCARTTRQRWYIDPGWDGNVFTHDHYGPSTHQQAGLYATMLIEPKGSEWYDPATGAKYGDRPDGGPTSWRADIYTADGDAYREFYLEFADFQVAYRSSEGDGAGGGPINFNGPNQAVNPSYRNAVGLPHVLQSNASPLFNAVTGAPLDIPGCGAYAGSAAGTWTGCAPEAISAADPGTFVVNYRQEPLALRLRDPLTNTQADPLLFGPQAGDLSYAFSSWPLRADNRLNADPSVPCAPGQTPSQTTPCWPYGGDATASEGAEIGDPFTPILRVYEGDKVSLRVQVGAHEEGHNFSMNGIRWLQNWQSGVSGFRSSQAAGISEYFIFDVPGLAAVKGGPFEDYMYQTGSSVDARWNGSWGIMRAYDGAQGILPDLKPLPTNLDGKTPALNTGGGPPPFQGVCPRGAPERKFDLVAVRAADVLPDFNGDGLGDLVYNNTLGDELFDPTAMLYLKKSDLDKQGKLRADRRVEPLILRAAAGECVFITLTNQLGGAPLDLDGFNTLPMIVHQFNNNQIAPSSEVGLHAQLVEYDMSDSDGMNVGFNPVQTVPPGGTTTYKWYAGRVDIVDPILGVPGNRVATPVEFGAINLMASDPIEGSSKGLIGALIIEPPGTTWPDGSGRGNERTTDGEFDEYGKLTRAAVTVTCPAGPCGSLGTDEYFRDFVVIHQDDVNMRFADGTPDGTPVPTVSHEEEPEDSGQKGLNYRTDPIWHRLGVGPTAAAAVTRTVDYTDAFAGDPQTPIYTAGVGERVRLRILKPGGHNRNSVPTLHGFVWARYPYSNDDGYYGGFDDSQYIDPANDNTFWHGEQQGHGPTNHINVVPLGGCPANGDFLYRDMVPVHVDNGEWAIIRCQ